MKVFNKEGNEIELATEEYVDKVYTVYNTDYINLHVACLEFKIERGIFLIIAEGIQNYQSVVIANFDEGYYDKYTPNIIHTYNNGFSYKANNSSGTILFDLPCERITVKLLSMY